MPLGPYEPFCGSEFKKSFFVKIVIFLLGIFRPQWPYFDTFGWKTDTKFTISAANYPWGHKTHKKGIWGHQRSLTSDDLGWPRKGHSVSANHGYHLPTPIHVHITSRHTEVRKFQALKRYGTQISPDMTPEIRSQVKCHSRYGLKIFREGVKLFNG